MNDYFPATLLSLEEKIVHLDNNDRRLLDEIANYMLMTHELLQNHRHCVKDLGDPPIAGNDMINQRDHYLGNIH